RALVPRIRAACLLVVAVSWLWAILRIVTFMVSMLGSAGGDGNKPSVTGFTKTYGPWILVATVFVPLLVAALANWLKTRPSNLLTTPDPVHGVSRSAADHLYSALVDPLAELAARLRWGVLIIVGFILTYAICYNIWASFAYPFYLDYLKYSKEEV